MCADNPNPNFFDISIVWRPADKTGYMLKKIASDKKYLGGSAWLAEKNAARVTLAKYLDKAAEIEKMVSGHGVGISTHKPDVPEDKLTKQWMKTVVPRIANSFTSVSDNDLQEISKHSLPKVLNSMSSMGLFLATPEFLDLIYIKLTGSKAPEGLASKLVELQGDIFSMLAKHPEIAEDLIVSGVAPTGSEEVDTDITSKLSHYIPSRSLDENWIYSHEKLAQDNPCQITLPRGVNMPEVTKIAAYTYSIYIAGLLDALDNPGYTKLDSLVSEDESGYRSNSAMPWAVTTILGLNHLVS